LAIEIAGPDKDLIAIINTLTTLLIKRGIKKKIPSNDLAPTSALGGDFEGGFKSPNPSKLPTTGLDKLSLAKLMNYTKDHANSLGTEDRKTLRDLLKKKGASRKFIAEVFGFGN